jgi:hypothetical protein
MEHGHRANVVRPIPPRYGSADETEQVERDRAAGSVSTLTYG